MKKPIDERHYRNYIKPSIATVELSRSLLDNTVSIPDIEFIEDAKDASNETIFDDEEDDE